MVVLPFQKRRQQLLFAALIVVIISIIIAWFLGFRALNPSSVSVPPSPASENNAPSLWKVPQLDWNFIASFDDANVFEQFSTTPPATGRKNPFLPY